MQPHRCLSHRKTFSCDSRVCARRIAKQQADLVSAEPKIARQDQQPVDVPRPEPSSHTKRFDSRRHRQFPGCQPSLQSVRARLRAMGNSLIDEQTCHRWLEVCRARAHIPETSNDPAPRSPLAHDIGCTRHAARLRRCQRKTLSLMQIVSAAVATATTTHPTATAEIMRPAIPTRRMPPDERVATRSRRVLAHTLCMDTFGAPVMRRHGEFHLSSREQQQLCPALLHQLPYL